MHATDEMFPRVKSFTTRCRKIASRDRTNLRSSFRVMHIELDSQETDPFPHSNSHGSFEDGELVLWNKLIKFRVRAHRTDRSRQLFAPCVINL